MRIIRKSVDLKRDYETDVGVVDVNFHRDMSHTANMFRSSIAALSGGAVPRPPYPLDVIEDGLIREGVRAVWGVQESGRDGFIISKDELPY
jgi:hypothetical protein